MPVPAPAPRIAPAPGPRRSVPPPPDSAHRRRKISPARSAVDRNGPPAGAPSSARRWPPARARAPRNPPRRRKRNPAAKRKAREAGGGEGGLPQEENGVLTDPIDSRFLTKDPFGAASFWIQPWRAYLDTWPSSTLLNSLGINFNVTQAQAEPVAQLLQESGFTLARREIPWGALSYEDPTQFRQRGQDRRDPRRHAKPRPAAADPAERQQRPAEPREDRLALDHARTAFPGAMTVHLDPASAALVVPGKTGFDGLTWGTGPDVLITSVNGEGLATLSRPLRSTLPAGKHARRWCSATRPSRIPKLPNGEPNPAFEETLDGWLSYVATVNAEATKVLGAGNYDLEVWNELTFGSQFLNAEHYYQPADSPDRGSRSRSAVGDRTSGSAGRTGRRRNRRKPRKPGQRPGDRRQRSRSRTLKNRPKVKATEKLHLRPPSARRWRMTAEETEEGPRQGSVQGDHQRQGHQSRHPDPAEGNRRLRPQPRQRHLARGRHQRRLRLPDALPLGRSRPDRADRAQQAPLQRRQAVPGRTTAKATSSRSTHSASATRRRRTGLQAAVRAPLPIAVPGVLPVGAPDRDAGSRHRPDHDRNLRPQARPRSRSGRRQPGAEVDDRVQHAIGQGRR